MRRCSEFFGEGFTVADYDWQNDDILLMSVDAADGVALYDAPAVLVDKFDVIDITPAAWK